MQPGRTPVILTVDDRTPSRALTVRDLVVGDAVEQVFAFDAAARRAFAQVANLFVGLCLMAGEKELAQKVRPSGRSPGQLASEEPSEAK